MSDTTPASRRRSVLDTANMTVTIPEVSTPFALDQLPAHVVTHLALRGLARDLLIHADPTLLFADLKAGKMTERKAAVPRGAANPWREAYAAALVEETKKGPSPVVKVDAEAAARRLDAAGLRRVKLNPAVVKHYGRITGVQTALVDLAA